MSLERRFLKVEKREEDEESYQVKSVARLKVNVHSNADINTRSYEKGMKKWVFTKGRWKKQIGLEDVAKALNI